MRRAAFAVGFMLSTGCSRPIEPKEQPSALPAAATVSVKVPAALSLARSLESLTVTFDPGALSTVVLERGAGMVMGMQVDTRAYPMGSLPPATGSTELSAPPAADFKAVWNAKEGIPAKGMRYAVDVEVTIFETDVPVGHMWMPQSDRYRVLWRRSLHQTEE